MLEMLISSSVLIAFLILLRRVLRGKIDLRLQYALWLLAAMRLLLPFSLFESSYSVLNAVDLNRGTPKTEITAPAPPVETAQLPVQEVGNVSPGFVPVPEVRDPAGQPPPAAGQGSVELPLATDILLKVWLAGAGAVGLWFVLQNLWFYRRLRQTRTLLEIPGYRLRVYQTPYIKSPCLFGLFCPAVYVQPGTGGRDMDYILAHEETHFRHGDHLWSYLRCVCLTLHWFNPLVWWAAALSRRDCELACDAGTVRRLGEAHRGAYGHTLVNMVARRLGPADLLCGATTMAAGKSGLKERIELLVRRPKMLAGTLIALILVVAIAVGCTFTGAKPVETSPPEESVTLYERGGLTLGVPKEYEDQLLIDPNNDTEESKLLSVYQKSTYEKYPGTGLLFHIVRYTQAQYEQFLCSDGSGQSFFARDDEHYYGFFHATDVQAPDDYEAFSALFAAVGDFVRSDMIARNGLTAYSDREFFDRAYTYDSAHLYYRYYPYLAYTGSRDVVWTLTLSQPATQGEWGIWCVERWRDDNGNVYPYFPNADGVPSAEYYAKRQAECDAGHFPGLMDPLQVARTFVQNVFEHDPGFDNLEPADNANTPEDLFAASTGNIHDYLPKLLAGETVSDYDLLPCLENFTRATWRELNEAYGDWWSPLWLALNDAAVGGMQADGADQRLRNYYIGKARLVSDGAYSEGLDDLLLKQWSYDSAAYSECLRTYFTAEEAQALRMSIYYSITYFSESPFGLTISDTGRSLQLGPYPIDFPFGFDFTEISRESFRAESFGMVTVVECDGLQITYLTPSEGVYNVIALRTTREDCPANGIEVGDGEQALLERYRDGTLKKLDGLHTDDEQWFGRFDYAYASVPEGRIWGILYLIQDGLVSGIAVLNGLDGPPY